MWQCDKTIQKISNFDNITWENLKVNNLNWPEIPNHSYKILVVGGSRSEKTNVLVNLIDHELNIDKIYWCANDPYEVKYQFLINKRECTGLKYLSDSKAFTEYWNNTNDIYKKILKNTNQIKHEKLCLFLIIWLQICIIMKKLIN